MKNLFLNNTNLIQQKTKQDKESKIDKYISLYMDIAWRLSEMSYASRLQVGSLIVKDGRIISFGWNGMPSGWDNKCEYSITDDKDNLVKVTKPEVLHSEANSISKLAKSEDSSKGATMFSTHSPCIECAKLIHQSEIKEFIYEVKYRNDEGLDFLKKCNINIIQV